jgi:retron-type reverse transcriptase
LFSVSCFLRSVFLSPRKGGFFLLNQIWPFSCTPLAVKTIRNLFPRVCDYENIYLAYRKARRGKRTKPGVASFERIQEEELLTIQEELLQKTYKPGKYHSFYIHDPKTRLISAAPFRDRVVHHALINVIEPTWEPKFIYDCYANRVGKGTHRAIDRCQQFARRYRYCLQCDVKQFFPSIDHAILRSILVSPVRDEQILWLCDQILSSGVGVLSEAYDMVYFPGDDLFAPLRPRGLPIGNLTSQFWANVYLYPLDQFVKRELKCTGYLRYVDDFLLFSDHKSQLWEWRGAVIEKLAELRLTLHARRAQVFPTSTGIPFLGFQIFPTHRLVKRRKVVQFRRKLRTLVREYRNDELLLDTLQASIQGWVNHVRYADSWGLRRSMLNIQI